jgi:hypothetical protein
MGDSVVHASQLNVAYRRGYIDLAGSDGTDKENSDFTTSVIGKKEILLLVKVKFTMHFHLLTATDGFIRQDTTELPRHARGA